MVSNEINFALLSLVRSAPENIGSHPEYSRSKKTFHKISRSISGNSFLSLSPTELQKMADNLKGPTNLDQERGRERLISVQKIQLELAVFQLDYGTWNKSAELFQTAAGT